MGECALPFPVIIARSWKDEDMISAKSVVLSSWIRCSAAMLAMNPMPGKPSIRMGLFSFGFSCISMVRTMVGLLLFSDVEKIII